MSSRSARRRRGRDHPARCWCRRVAVGRVTWRSQDDRFEIGGMPACIDHLRPVTWPAEVQAGLYAESVALNARWAEVCPICRDGFPQGGEVEHLH
jgi:hypothetical protein